MSKTSPRQAAKAALEALCGPAASNTKHGLFHLSIWDTATSVHRAMDTAFGPHRVRATADGRMDTFPAKVWMVEGREVCTNRAGQIELW